VICVSLADKLEELDISYARRAEEESVKCQLSVEDRLLSFQRDLEVRYKQQLETELELYRSRELAKVRQEERDRHREELAKEKSDLQCAHQLKLEEVRKSEQRLVEKYRMKEQVLMDHD
jgi:oral-facial-digital syndrome 1 protein